VNNSLRLSSPPFHSTPLLLTATIYGHDNGNTKDAEGDISAWLCVVRIQYIILPSRLSRLKNENVMVMLRAKRLSLNFFHPHFLLSPPSHPAPQPALEGY